MSALPQDSVRNRLLRAISPADFDLLAGALEPVVLERHQVIAAPDQQVDHIYFPETGIASVITETQDRRRLEVGLYGREGLSGCWLALGVDHTPHKHLVQVPGSGLRIASGELMNAISASSSLKRVILRYAHVFAIQTSYTALSNGSYNVNERLARWLLMCDDRSDDGVNLTHEFLSVMLSVRRSSVTVALRTLEKAGLIETNRGHIALRDRAPLMELAGESYGAPEAEYERLIGPLN